MGVTQGSLSAHRFAGLLLGTAMRSLHLTFPWAFPDSLFCALGTKPRAGLLVPGTRSIEPAFAQLLLRHPSVFPV
jgi:hypothetical protein